MTELGWVQRFQIEYDPQLVEASVLLRVERDPEEKCFRQAHDLIYELRDAEERERQFRNLHSKWFVHFRLEQPTREAVQEQPLLAQKTLRCCVVSTPSVREEGADLHDLRDSSPMDSPPVRVILIQLRPERLLDSGLRYWLRRELMHVADMLDPGFGYERFIPSGNGGPGYSNLLRERYRVLWNIWIDGRLVRRAWLPEEVRAKRLQEFTQFFPDPGGGVESKFNELFCSDFQTHAGLMALARNPKNSGPENVGVPQVRFCPICLFPSFNLIDGIADLPWETRKEITEDFPDWRPEQGICRQCADLFQARELSRSAEAALPKA